MNKKGKKNGVDNKDNTKSPSNDIIISHSLFLDKHDEIALSSKCALPSNTIEQSVASKIITINNDIDTHSHSETDKFKVNKEVNKTKNNKISEMEFNNNMIEDKEKGSLNHCV